MGLIGALQLGTFIWLEYKEFPISSDVGLGKGGRACKYFEDLVKGIKFIRV